MTPVSTAANKLLPTVKTGTQTKPASNAVSFFYVAQDQEEQSAINKLSINGDMSKSPMGTPQVPLDVREYELLTDDNGVVEAIALTCESMTGNTCELTYLYRPRDQKEIDRLVDFTNQGTRKLTGGKVYLQQSQFDSNKGMWVGKVTLFFSKFVRPQTPRPVNPPPPSVPQPEVIFKTPPQQPQQQPATVGNDIDELKCLYREIKKPTAPVTPMPFTMAVDRAVQKVWELVKAGKVAEPTETEVETIRERVRQSFAPPPVRIERLVDEEPLNPPPAAPKQPNHKAKGTRRGTTRKGTVQKEERSESHRQNLSLSLTGRKLSPEHRKNISEGQKRRNAELRALRNRPIASE